MTKQLNLSLDVIYIFIVCCRKIIPIIPFFPEKFKFKYSEFVEAASSRRRGRADSTAAKGELLQFAARRAFGWWFDRPVFVVVVVKFVATVHFTVLSVDSYFTLN